MFLSESNFSIKLKEINNNNNNIINNPLMRIM